MKFIPPMPVVLAPAPVVEAPLPVEVLPKMWLGEVAEHAIATAAGRAREATSAKGERRKARGWVTATLLEKSSRGGSVYAERIPDGNGEEASRECAPRSYPATRPLAVAVW
jgi:hypothetical protein